MLQDNIDVYKIGVRKSRLFRNRHPDKWFRTWQAEMNLESCMWAARAYTKRGSRVKMWRWYCKGTDIKKHERKYGPNQDAWNMRYIELEGGVQ